MRFAYPAYTAMVTGFVAGWISDSRIRHNG